MAVTANSVILPQQPRIEPQNFVQATDTAGTLKTIFTPGANGAKVSGITLSTDDPTVAHDFEIYLTRSAVNYLIGTVAIPINSGKDGVAPGVAGLDLTLIPGLPVDNDGQPYLLLEAADTLKGTFVTALTAGDRIDCVCVGSDF